MSRDKLSLGLCFCLDEADLKDWFLSDLGKYTNIFKDILGGILKISLFFFFHRASRYNCLSPPSLFPPSHSLLNHCHLASYLSFSLHWNTTGKGGKWLHAIWFGGHFPVLILFDLSATFHTVAQVLLCETLSSFGFHDPFSVLFLCLFHHSSPSLPSGLVSSAFCAWHLPLFIWHSFPGQPAGSTIPWFPVPTYWTSSPFSWWFRGTANSIMSKTLPLIFTSTSLCLPPLLFFLLYSLHWFMEPYLFVYLLPPSSKSWFFISHLGPLTSLYTQHHPIWWTPSLNCLLNLSLLSMPIDYHNGLLTGPLPLASPLLNHPPYDSPDDFPKR